MNSTRFQHLINSLIVRALLVLTGLLFVLFAVVTSGSIYFEASPDFKVQAAIIAIPLGFALGSIGGWFIHRAIRAGR